MKKALSRKELEDELDSIFNPDPDGVEFTPIVAMPSLKAKYPHLDFSYLNPWDSENSSMHRDSHICLPGETRLQNVTQNLFVSELLFGAGLRALHDSIVEYHEREERDGDLRFYPPAILTFWSAFETFIRDISERFTIVCKGVPPEVVDFLLERERGVDDRGEVRERTRWQAPLNRYRVLLKYGYGFEVNRGDSYWQKLVKAQELRDYYTHLDITAARTISTNDVLEYFESILMAIIQPSAMLKKTLLLRVYDIWNLFDKLREYASPFVEKPPIMTLHMNDGFCFHCNFVNIDTVRFPSLREKMGQV